MRARILGVPCTRWQLQGGLSLLELLVVLIILAIVVTAGVATCTKMFEHGRAEVAINDLRVIRAREETRRSITGAYINGTLTGAAQLNPAPSNTNLLLDLTDGPYICTLTGGGATFTATANPSAARPNAGTITLNQAGAWGGTSPFVPGAQE